MKTIWKFPLQMIGDQVVMIPRHAAVEVISLIRHVGLDPDGVPCLWVEVDESLPASDCTVYIRGTGWAIPEGNVRHVGNFVHIKLVWHVWIAANS